MPKPNEYKCCPHRVGKDTMWIHGWIAGINNLIGGADTHKLEYQGEPTDETILKEMNNENMDYENFLKELEEQQFESEEDTDTEYMETNEGDKEEENEDEMEFREIEKLQVKDEDWIGHNMSYKTIGAIRMATITVDSAIKAEQAESIAIQITEWYRKIGIDILVMAETATGTDTNAYATIKKKLRKSNINAEITSTESHGYKKGQGVIITWKEDIGKLYESEECCGRAIKIGLEMEMEDTKELQKMQIIGVYAPSGHGITNKKEVQEETRKLITWLAKHTQKETIVLGDMNSIPNEELDAGTRRNQMNNTVAGTLINRWNGEDTFRSNHPATRAYTNEANGSKARIDHIINMSNKLRTGESAIWDKKVDKTTHKMMITDFYGGTEIGNTQKTDPERGGLNWRELKRLIHLKKKEGKNIIELLKRKKGEKGRNMDHMIQWQESIIETTIEIENCQDRSRKTCETIYKGVTKLEQTLEDILENLQGEIKEPNDAKNIKKYNVWKVRNMDTKLMEKAIKSIETFEEIQDTQNEYHDTLKSECEEDIKELNKYLRSNLKMLNGIIEGAAEKWKQIWKTKNKRERREKTKQWALEASEGIRRNRKQTINEAVKHKKKNRRTARRQNDTRSFFNMLKKKNLETGGYKPKKLQLQEKEIVPKTQNEVLEAAIQEHSWMSTTGWPTKIEEQDPTFMTHFTEGYEEENDMNIKRTKVKENWEPTDEIGIMIKEAMEKIGAKERNWEIEGRINEKMTKEEYQEYKSKSRQKSPGITGFKITIIEEIGGILEQLMKTIIDKMIQLSIIPEEMMKVLCVHIPKGNIAAGTRPLGLIHEITKIVMYVTTTRLMRASTAQGNAGMVRTNQAYREGRATSDAIIQDLILSIWSKRWTIRSKETKSIEESPIRLEYDLNGFFDGIITEIIEVSAKILGIPEEIQQIWAQTSSSLEYKILTIQGMTKEIKTKVGVTQGAQESPVRALVALEIMTEILNELLKECKATWKEFEEIEEIPENEKHEMLGWQYSDDGGTHIRYGKVKWLLEKLNKIGASLGISLKPSKIKIQAWDKRIIGERIEIKTWNWKNQEMEYSTIKVEDADTTTWRTLGVHISGNPEKQSHAEIKGRQIQSAMHQILKQNLAIEELAPAIEALWASRIQYGALCYYIEDEKLWEWENAKKQAVRTSIQIPRTVPLQGHAVDREKGGLGIITAKGARLQSLLREMMASLWTDNTSGKLIREEVKQLKKEGTTKNKGIIGKNMDYLTAHGYIIRDTQEMMVNRWMDEIQKKIGWKPLEINAKHDEGKIQKNAEISNISRTAQIVRQYLNAELEMTYRRMVNLEKMIKKDKLIKDERIRKITTTEWSDIRDKAMKSAKQDRKQEAELNGTMEWEIAEITDYKEKRCKTSEIDKQRKITQEGWKFLDGSVLTHEWYERQNGIRRKIRGAGTGSAIVTKNDLGETVNIKHILWPARYGNKNSTNQMAEMIPMIWAIGEGDTMPIVSDSLCTIRILQKGKINTNEWNFRNNEEGICKICYQEESKMDIRNKESQGEWIPICKKCLRTQFGSETNGRDLTKLHNVTLAHRLIELKKDKTRKQEKAPEGWEKWARKDYNKTESETKAFPGCTGEQKIIKFPSHSKEKHENRMKEICEELRTEWVMKPDEFSYEGNDEVDEEAGIAAMQAAEKKRNVVVKYPLTDLKHILVQNGEVCMQPAAQIVTKDLQEQLMNEWGNTKERPQMGAFARVEKEADKITKNLQIYEELPRPKELHKFSAKPKTLNAIRVAFKVRTGTGGCWSQASRRKGIIGTIATKGNPQSSLPAIGETCPICRKGHGNIRHAMWSCTHEKFKEIRNIITKKIEIIISGSIPGTNEQIKERIEERLLNAKEREREIIDEDKDKYPILQKLGWYLRRKDDREQEQKPEKDTIWQLTHKAIIPKEIQKIFKPNNEEEWEKTEKEKYKDMIQQVARWNIWHIILVREEYIKWSTQYAQEMMMENPTNKVADKLRREMNNPTDNATEPAEEYRNCEGYLCARKKRVMDTKPNQVKGKTKCWQCNYYVAQSQVMRTILDKGETDTHENTNIHNWMKETQTIEKIKTMLKQYGISKEDEAIVRKTESSQVKDLTTMDIKIKKGVQWSGYAYKTDGRTYNSITDEQISKDCRCKGETQEIGMVCDICMGSRKNQIYPINFCYICGLSDTRSHCNRCGMGVHENCKHRKIEAATKYWCKECEIHYSREFHEKNESIPDGKWEKINSMDRKRKREEPKEYKGKVKHRNEKGKNKGSGKGKNNRKGKGKGNEWDKQGKKGGAKGTMDKQQEGVRNKRSRDGQNELHNQRKKTMGKIK